MSGNMTDEELAKLRAAGNSIRADPGEFLYLLQGNHERNHSRIVKVDDQGNKEIVLDNMTIPEGHATMAAYSESLGYRKH